jgi:hypothetical protein
MPSAAASSGWLAYGSSVGGGARFEFELELIREEKAMLGVVC